MARNRRNIRRRSIKEYLNMKTFLIIVGILVAIIVVSIGINGTRLYFDRKEIAKQQEEIRQQSEEIFSQITDNINQANQNISESDVLIKMSAVGDILCSQEMLDDAYNEQTKSYNFSHMFSRVSGFIDEADIVMGTMETGITDSKEYNSQNAPIEFAQAVKNSGVNLVTIAHNHSLDNGVDGLSETQKNLEKLDYSVIGSQIETANSVEIREVKGAKVAFLSYTCFMDNEQAKDKEELNCVNMYSEEKALEDIEYAKENGAEYICVMIHWGDAITETVNSEQKETADFLVENDVDLILGSHPSVVQPMEVRKNKDGDNVFIAYSIGTYISTLSSEDARTELVLNIELRKSGIDGKVTLNKVNYTPIYMLDNGADAQNRFELIDMKGTVTSYSLGSTEGISRETYDKLVRALNRLNGLFGGDAA